MNALPPIIQGCFGAENARLVREKIAENASIVLTNPVSAVRIK